MNRKRCGRKRSLLNWR